MRRETVKGGDITCDPISDENACYDARCDGVLECPHRGPVPQQNQPQNREKKQEHRVQSPRIQEVQVEQLMRRTQAAASRTIISRHPVERARGIYPAARWIQAEKDDCPGSQGY